jgi:hypothetical protein
VIRTRRVVTFVLGAWLGMSIWMSAVAIQNLRAVDNILQNPSAAAARYLMGVGTERAASFMRHQAAEMNRALFESWGWTQLAIGCGLFLLLLFARHARRSSIILSFLMLVIVIAMTFVIVPEMRGSGRATDFSAQNSSSPERGRFRMLHSTYLALEGVKLLLGAALCAMYFWGHSRPERATLERRKVYVVDDADDSHVDG